MVNKKAGRMKAIHATTDGGARVRRRVELSGIINSLEAQLRRSINNPIRFRHEQAPDTAIREGIYLGLGEEENEPVLRFAYQEGRALRRLYASVDGAEVVDDSRTMTVHYRTVVGGTPEMRTNEAGYQEAHQLFLTHSR